MKDITIKELLTMLANEGDVTILDLTMAFQDGEITIDGTLAADWKEEDNELHDLKED